MILLFVPTILALAVALGLGIAPIFRFTRKGGQR
jgi:hypothetical protein